jgi:hypothetical protein
MAPNLKGLGIFLFVFTYFCSINCEVTPIVLWHGMGKILVNLIINLNLFLNLLFYLF